MPRKPLSAYILYFQKRKPEFSSKHPGLTLAELTKLIAKDWKDEDNDSKADYIKRASEDRKRYYIEMSNLKA